MTTGLPVRVWVPEVWDVVSVVAAPDWTVRQLVETALVAATGRRCDPSDYCAKFRGALITDQSQKLSDLDVPAAAPFIVLSARRQPVR